MSLTQIINTMPTGVPHPFNPEQAAQIIELLSDGEPMPNVAKALGLSTWLIGKWMRLQPLFRQAVRLARADGIDATVDDYHARLRAGTMDHHQARTEGEFIKWISAVRNKDYRLAQQIEVVTTDMQGDLLEARKRTMLPILHLGQEQIAQDVDYVSIPYSPTADTESAVLPKGCVNPFD
jgi:hypothetical protein